MVCTQYQIPLRRRVYPGYLALSLRGKKKGDFREEWGGVREEVSLIFSLPSTPLRGVCKGGGIKNKVKEAE